MASGFGNFTVGGLKSTQEAPQVDFRLRYPNKPFTERPCHLAALSNLKSEAQGCGFENPYLSYDLAASKDAMRNTLDSPGNPKFARNP